MFVHVLKRARTYTASSFIIITTYIWCTTTVSFDIVREKK